MYIAEGNIIGYKFDLYYDTTLIHEDDEVFETEEDAREWASELIDERIAEWCEDDAWHENEGDSRLLFDVVIHDVVEEE